MTSRKTMGNCLAYGCACVCVRWRNKRTDFPFDIVARVNCCTVKQCSVQWNASLRKLCIISKSIGISSSHLQRVFVQSLQRQMHCSQLTHPSFSTQSIQHGIIANDWLDDICAMHCSKQWRCSAAGSTAKWIEIILFTYFKYCSEY